MPLTKQELLELLNQKARGIRPVTLRQLSDWIDSGLIEKARAQGVRRGTNPVWQLSEDAVDRALLMLESRSLGSTRKTQHLLFVWVKGHDYPFVTLKTALKSEFARLVKRQQRQHLGTFDVANRAPAKDRERAIRKMTETDKRLEKAGLNLPKSDMLTLISEATWGSNRKEGAKAISDYVNKFAGSNFADRFDSVRSWVNISGQFGDPEEIEGSGIELLDIATESDFAAGRARFCRLVMPLKELSSATIFPDLQPAFRAAYDSILSPDWLVSMLASTVVAAHKERTCSII